MTEKQILFNGPMVRAILEGRKTQTRRVVKPVGCDGGFVLLDHGDGWWPYRSDDGDSSSHTVKRGGKLYHDETAHECPYGKPGELLWVREKCRAEELESGLDGVRYLADDAFLPIDNTEQAGDNWIDLRDYGKRPSPVAQIKTVPSIHMPRWASRITLEITAVRVERLNDISDDDCLAEGIAQVVREKMPSVQLCGEYDAIDVDPVAEYRDLWESINGHGSWAANPWVWVVAFKRVIP